MNTQIETITSEAGGPHPGIIPAAGIAEAEQRDDAAVSAPDKQTAAEAIHETETITSGAEAVEPVATPEHPAAEPEQSPSVVQDGGALQSAETAAIRDYGMPVHEVCDLFPLMDDADLHRLAADIRQNGLVHPIVRHEGQLVDGRNRAIACRIAGVEPRYVEWRDVYRGPMSLHRWILSLNAERRHLTVDQIAITQAALVTWELADAGRQRQTEAGRQQGEHGKEGGRGNTKAPATNSLQGVPGAEADASKTKSPRDRSGATREQLAKQVGVSAHKAQQALTVYSGPRFSDQAIS
jgi:hypothetical protein